MIFIALAMFWRPFGHWKLFAFILPRKLSNLSHQCFDFMIRTHYSPSRKIRQTLMALPCLKNLDLKEYWFWIKTNKKKVLIELWGKLRFLYSKLIWVKLYYSFFSSGFDNLSVIIVSRLFSCSFWKKVDFIQTKVFRLTKYLFFQKKWQIRKAFIYQKSEDFLKILFLIWVFPNFSRK